MRVLLDENIPHALRNLLTPHEVITAAYAGLAGLKKGALLRAAIETGFEVLVSADKTLHYEQNLAGSPIAIVLHVRQRLARDQAAGRGHCIGHPRGQTGTVTKVDCGR